MAYGIKETKELAAFGFSLGKGIKSALADDKITFFDAFAFRDALSKASPALSGLDLIDDEIKDLTVEELAELEQFTLAEMTELGLTGAWQVYLKIAIQFAEVAIKIVSMLSPTQPEAPSV